MHALLFVFHFFGGYYNLVGYDHDAYEALGTHRIGIDLFKLLRGLVKLVGVTRADVNVGLACMRLGLVRLGKLVLLGLIQMFAKVGQCFGLYLLRLDKVKVRVVVLLGSGLDCSTFGRYL